MLARKQLKRVTIQGFGKIIFAHTSPRTRQQWRLYKAVLKYRPVKASPLTPPHPLYWCAKIFLQTSPTVFSFRIWRQISSHSCLYTLVHLRTAKFAKERRNNWYEEKYDRLRMSNFANFHSSKGGGVGSKPSFCDAILPPVHGSMRRQQTRLQVFCKLHLSAHAVSDLQLCRNRDGYGQRRGGEGGGGGVPTKN